jgi:hypothetical protein
MNNFKNNNRRGRFKPNGERNFRRNGNGHKNNSDFGNGSSFKRRHPGKNNQNAAKLVEKYNDLAREALSNGDKILSENYLQHSEHFSRILISQENYKNNNENITDANTSNQIKTDTLEKEAEETTTK